MSGAVGYDGKVTPRARGGRFTSSTVRAPVPDIPDAAPATPPEPPATEQLQALREETREAVSGVNDTIRGVEPEPEPREPTATATETLARLKALRQSQGGFLVPPPPGINAAMVTWPVATGLPTPNKGLQTAEAWFRAIVAAGGSPQDLQRAWETWRPAAVGNASPKPASLAVFEQLMAQAGPRHVELRRRAEAEALPAKILADTRQALRLAEYELATEMRRHVAPLQKRVDGLKAVIVTLEAQQ